MHRVWVYRWFNVYLVEKSGRSGMDKRDILVVAGTSILSFRADLTLWTDASPYGWGAHLEDRNVLGKWTVIEQSSPINLLELSAVENALHHFRDYVKHRQVLLRTDNSTVVSYINRQGGQSLQSCVWWRGGFCIGVTFLGYSSKQLTFRGKGM